MLYLNGTREDALFEDCDKRVGVLEEHVAQVALRERDERGVALVLRGKVVLGVGNIGAVRIKERGVDLGLRSPARSGAERGYMRDLELEVAHASRASG